MKSLYQVVESIMDDDDVIAENAKIVEKTYTLLKTIADQINDTIKHTSIRRLGEPMIGKHRNSCSVKYTYTNDQDRLSIIDDLYKSKHIQKLIKDNVLFLYSVNASDTLVLNIVDKDILKYYNTEYFYIEIDPDYKPDIRIGGYDSLMLGEMFMNILTKKK